MDDFRRYKFEKIEEIGDYNIDNFPLYLNSDGVVLIIKDKSEVIRDPTPEEAKFFCRPKRDSIKKGLTTCSSNESCSTNESEKLKKPKLSNSFKKDKGIVITVKKTESNELIKEE